MFKYSVVTNERTVRTGEANAIIAMTESGEITILKGHIPLLSALKPGVVTVNTEGDEDFFSVSTGFIEVRQNGEVVLLADTAEHSDELDLQVIEKAKNDARRIMEEKRHIDDEAFAHAAAALERELAKEKVARKKKH